MRLLSSNFFKLFYGSCCEPNRKFIHGAQSVNAAVTVKCKLGEWNKVFKEHFIEEPKVSAEYIVAHVLGRKTFNGINCSWLLTADEVQQIDVLANKRLAKLPVQYVIEEWDFGDLTLRMRPPVFIPRPETQGLVDTVIEEVNSSSFPVFNLLEVGCGSGAITLSLLHALNQGVVKKPLLCTTIDKDESAIQLTKENGVLTKINNFKLLHDDIGTLQLNDVFDGIVSNPPYIPSREIGNLQPEILKYESSLALDGGSDGLDVVKKIVGAASTLLRKNGWIWLEVDTTHPALLQNLFPNFKLEQVKRDFLDRERFVKLVKVS